MAEAELKDIKRFFSDYAALEESINEESSGIILSECQRLFNEVKPLLDKAEEAEKFTAPHYNIFSVLKIDTLETAVHTPMLANLLNPAGNHSQKNLYSNLFFQAILGIENANIEEIIDEHYTNYGIIDIYIRCKYLNMDYYIIIENKVNASDGIKQLERYHNYLTYSLRLKKNQFIMLYLTPDGREPNAISINQTLFKKLLADGNIRLISYHEDIAYWLRKCINETLPSSVKELLIQYRSLIKSL